MQAQRAIGVGLTICLVLSLLLHAGVIGGGGWYFGAVKPLVEVTVSPPIVVDTITVSDVAKLRQGSRTAKLENAEAKEVPKPDEAKKEAPRPKPIAAEPPPPAASEPPPAPKEEPKPEPVKADTPPPPAPEEKPDQAALAQKLEELAMVQAREDEKKAEAAAKAKAAAEAKAKAEADAKAKAEAEAKKKAEEKRKRDIAEAKRKADEKKKAEAERAKENSKSTADRVAALLDKTPDAKQAPAAAPVSAVPTKDKGPVKGAKEGRDSANAANEASLLLSAIVSRIRDQGCWNIQAGGELAAAQVPKIQFELNQDGSVRGEPRVLNPQGSGQFQLAADAARSAILKCAPYPLPADKYQMWKKVTLDFDPREMFQ